MMQLSKFPRRKYLDGPTKIHRLNRLSEKLGGSNIYIKRDDLLPGAGCGNKTRKLEYLVADALQQGCDTLVTVGAPQSNHCRLTAWAAAHEGLECHLVLEERVPGSFHADAGGNNLLYQLLGVKTVTVVPKGGAATAELAAVCARLTEHGRRPYSIPGGGSNQVGSLGYVSCAQEMLEQLKQDCLVIDHVVVPANSGGTHAGLLVGLHGSGASIPVHGINVSRKKQPQEELIAGMAALDAENLGFTEPIISREDVCCYDDYVGEGYTQPTEGMIEAVTLTAQLEGILLDPVYSGKAMAGLIDLVRKGVFKKGENVLFIATGGVPALFQYASMFDGKFTTQYVNKLH